MKETITSFIGLDVHKDSIAVAVAQAGRQPPHFIGTVEPQMHSVCKALRRIARASTALVVYEAGPCGYGLARYRLKQGYACEVVAPAHIARNPIEQRIKTDRRDALRLARESRAGNLVPIVLPDTRDEAMRDLARNREDVVAARLRARQQLSALLLRHGYAYQGKSTWTAAHQRHLSTIRLEHPAQQIAFVEYRSGIQDAHERLERVTRAMHDQLPLWRMQPMVRALMCLRGLDLIGATSLVAELGDLRRFPHPKSLMAYLGLLPSEFSSGNTPRLGSITKSGNKHARGMLVEAAWSYRSGIAHIGRELQVRQQDQPKLLREISWRAQLRLTKRFRHLRLARKLPHNKVCIAVARELCGFVWDIAQHITPQP